jgi:hypothetical protein
MWWNVQKIRWCGYVQRHEHDMVECAILSFLVLATNSKEIISAAYATPTEEQSE